MRPIPQRRFYFIVILMVATLITGMATGFGLFYRVLYLLGLAVILSYLWTWLGTLALDVTVRRSSKRVSVGEALEAQVTVENRSRLPKPVVLVEDLTDLPGYRNAMALAVPPNGSRSWTDSAPARKRGVYTMGPMSVVSSDPFGVFRGELTFGDAETLVVYPRTHDLPEFGIPAADLAGDSALNRRTHDLTPHASTVRDYEFGDSLSRIHWGTTARLGKLMSKEFDLGRSSDVWVVVDLHRDVQAGGLEESTDEYAVSIGASLAKRYLQDQLPVGLIAYGEQRYLMPPDTGAGQFDRIIEFLARSKADGRAPLGTVLPRDEHLWNHHSSVIVVTSSPRSDWVVALRELARRRVRVAAVLVDGASFGGFLNTLDVLGDVRAAGLPAYVVQRGDNIRTALSRTHNLVQDEVGAAVELGAGA